MRILSHLVSYYGKLWRQSAKNLHYAQQSQSAWRTLNEKVDIVRPHADEAGAAAVDAS